MNKPVPSTSFTADAPDYATDGYGWAMHQAALIRAGERVELDWNNIAEEIESVGKSEYEAVESALRLVLLHLLKWNHQPTHRSRSWANSIKEHLRRFDRKLAKNPGLKGELEQMLEDAYSDARFDAAAATGLEIDAFPLQPPTWDDIRTPRPLT